MQLRLVDQRRPIFEEFHTITGGNSDDAIQWLQRRVDGIVNVFRPRVKAIVQNIAALGG